MGREHTGIQIFGPPRTNNCLPGEILLQHQEDEPETELEAQRELTLSGPAKKDT